MMDIDALARVFGQPDAEQPTRAAERPPEVPADPDLGSPIGEAPAWREAQEERAAVLEFESGLSREAAEAQAARLHPDPTTERARRLWVLTLPDGETVEVSCTPPQTRSGVLAGRPRGTRAEAAAEPAPAAALAPDLVALVSVYLGEIGEDDPALRAELLELARSSPRVQALYRARGAAPAEPDGTPEPRRSVTCGSCRYFERDRIGDGSGLGACRIGAPASRRAPALWPNAVHACGRWAADSPFPVPAERLPGSPPDQPHPLS